MINQTMSPKELPAQLRDRVGWKLRSGKATKEFC